jgi:hypothetical protein
MTPSARRFPRWPVILAFSFALATFVFTFGLEAPLWQVVGLTIATFLIFWVGTALIAMASRSSSCAGLGLALLVAGALLTIFAILLGLLLLSNVDLLGLDLPALELPVFDVVLPTSTSTTRGACECYPPPAAINRFKCFCGEVSRVTRNQTRNVLHITCGSWLLVVTSELQHPPFREGECVAVCGIVQQDRDEGFFFIDLDAPDSQGIRRSVCP